MFKKYDITIKKKEAGIPYRRNLQIWSESIEKVLKIMGIKLHKDPKYFGYNIVDIKSAEDSFYNINYDTIISSQEKENDVVSELYDFMIWGDYDAKIQTLANMTDEKTFDKDLFESITQTITIYKDGRVMFTLKNGVNVTEMLP